MLKPFKAIKRWVTPEPVVVRLVTVKDVALALGWSEEEIHTKGITVGKVMAAKYRDLTGEEPYDVPQEINGKIRYVFGYPQEYLRELGAAFRVVGGNGR